MQLSDYTKKLLENFVSINQGIVILKTKDGANSTEIRTLDREQAIYAQAVIPEVFTTNVCLYDLKATLAVLSGFSTPTIDLHDSHMIVKEGNSSVKILFAEPETIIHPPVGIDPIKSHSDELVNFELKQESLVKVLNFSGILGLPNLRVFSENGTLFLQALDAKNPNTNTTEVELGISTAEVDVYIKRENIRMIPGDYQVSINKKAAMFQNLVNKDLYYYVSLDKKPRG